MTRRALSLWLREALAEPATPAPTLSGKLHADVTIVGGGYVGLWTAIELKARQPSLRVVVLEQDVCGSGASGRNGGYVLSWWPKAASLCKQFGDATARDLIQKSVQAIGEIEAFCTAEGIAADFQRCGWVWGAESSHYSGAWLPAVAACERLGVGQFELLDRLAAARRSGTAVFQSGVLDRTAALLHPARLARGLREVAIRRGVDIYEHSPMRRFSRSRPVEVQCASGTVRSDVLILATNAWSASIAELSRSIVVVSSDMIASQPVPLQLDSIGWRDGAGVNGSQTMVDYVRTTVSGRVLAGKGGLAVAYGGRVHPGLFHSPRRAAIVHRSMRRLYPAFAALPIDCSWSGPVDRSSNGLPILGRLPRSPNVLYGIGWSGNGVGPSRIGARALASMALGQEDEWSTLPIVCALRRDMPAEPLRFLGAHVVRAAVRRKDFAEANDRQPSRMVCALAALAPRGVED